MTRREWMFGGVAFAIHQGKIEEAVRLLEAQTVSGFIGAATLYVRDGGTVVERAFGKASKPQAIYLLASITKPMTVAGLMLLVDRKQVSLSDPVQRFIPEFRGDGREKVVVKHLLNHTSGLPDMLPENVDLRKRHAPLSDFVAGTCRTALLFTPGTQVKYQSMGILLAAEFAQRITKQPFPEFLKEHVFRPLGLQRTSLGLGERKISETMYSQVDEVNDWDWNSSYWRNLASPWGGAHADAADVARFLQLFAHADGRVLKPETAVAMVTNQTGAMKPRWGLGWTLNNGKLSKGGSQETFGHGGSTGTLSWHDPRRNRTFVLLTTKPAIHSNEKVLYPVSDLVSAL